MAHHRRRRRRSDRRRARGADPRAGRPEPATASSRRSIRRPCGWCSSTAARSRSLPSAIGSGAAAVRQLEDLGVELRMNARVTNVDGRGVDVETKGGTERIVARTVVWAAGVQASPLAAALADATGARDRPRRADRGAARPHAARPPRGVRGRRHGHATRTSPASPRSPCKAGCTPRTRSNAASTATSDPCRSLPRSRDRGHDRTVPCGVQRPRDPPQRVACVDRLAVRPPRVPERLREPLRDPSPMDDVDARTRPTGTRLQRRAHRRRPEHPRLRPRRGAADPVSGSGHTRYSRSDGPSVRRRPGAVGAVADGVHARVPHHPGAARRVVGVHGAGRELPRDQERTTPTRCCSRSGGRSTWR